MSYTALYRKFRPSEFEDVKGQDHIVKTLQNQIKANRIGHAYLFCGTRGTGKTTVAKIFAKAVNCETPIEGSPCGRCDMCKEIGASASMNVMEIDAASNNGVDSIREIREEVEYRPTKGKYKVYIVDEVHMLSTSAFNALLKTLEEPPEYVIFILATTELHKIPATILSRCQHYDFKRITIETISKRLEHLVNVEEIEAESKAIRYIAKAADGSMRDALSILDQCIAFYLGHPLTYNNVLEVLGAVDTEKYSVLLRQIIARDVVGVLTTLEILIMEGRELTQLVNDFTWYQRNLLLVKGSDDMEDVLDVSSENLKQLKEEAEMIEMNTLLRYIRIFSDLSNKMRYATQKRVILEVALIKMCSPKMEEDTESVLDRVKVLEETVENGIVAQPQVHAVVSVPSVSSEKKVKLELPKAMPEEVAAVAKNFRGIISKASGLLKVYLKQARISMGENGELLIVVDDDQALLQLKDSKSIEEIEQLIEDSVQKSVKIAIRGIEKDRNFDDVFVDIEKIVQMDIMIEDN